MTCIKICTRVRKTGIAAIFGALFCLAGCGEAGPGKEGLAPPKNVEGLAKSTEGAPPPTTATGEDYNAQMKRQQEERQKKGSVYPGKK